MYNWKHTKEKVSVGVPSAAMIEKFLAKIFVCFSIFSFFSICSFRPVLFVFYHCTMNEDFRISKHCLRLQRRRSNTS